MESGKGESFDEQTKYILNHTDVDSKEELGPKHLAYIIAAMCTVTARWHHIGTHLLVAEESLEQFERMFQFAPNVRLIFTIDAWLQNVNCKHTWRDVVIAVSTGTAGGNPTEAQKLAKVGSIQKYIRTKCSVPQSSGVSEAPLTSNPETVRDVTTALKEVKACWMEIGIFLGLTSDSLKSILSQPGSDKIGPVVRMYLKGQYMFHEREMFGEKPTWKRLVEAIGSRAGANNGFEAERIAKMHQVTTVSSMAMAIETPKEKDDNDRGNEKTTMAVETPKQKSDTTRSIDKPPFDLHNKRGLAILITCDYRNSQNPLPTTMIDGEEMNTTLLQFEYDVYWLKNEDATKVNIEKMLMAVQEYLSTYDGPDKNADEREKAIIFAFSGHGDCDQAQNDLIETNDKHLMRVSEIVQSFLKQRTRKIPKLFFFDACRGHQQLQASQYRTDEAGEVNYRIEYATITNHAAPARDLWMILIAQKLRERDESLGDVMARVKKEVYVKSGTIPQQPESLDRLITGPLKLYYLNKDEKK